MTTDPQYENITLEVSEGVATLTVSRPSKLNALNEATLDEIERATVRVAEDADVRGVLVTGAGEKAFVAGADLEELSRKTAADGHLAARRGQSVFRAIETLGKPVVAAINGFALGGGLELALACHLRVASESAELGLPEVSLGLIPGYGGTQRLARLVGRGRALELILTGDRIGALEAHRIGLVNRVVPPGELLEASRKLLGRILSRGPIAVRNALLAVDQGLDAGLEQGLLIEATLFGSLFGTADTEEGIRAFLEKRRARFEGK